MMTEGDLVFHTGSESPEKSGSVCRFDAEKSGEEEREGSSGRHSTYIYPAVSDPAEPVKRNERRVPGDDVDGVLPNSYFPSRSQSDDYPRVRSPFIEPGTIEYPKVFRPVSNAKLPSPPTPTSGEAGTPIDLRADSIESTMSRYRAAVAVVNAGSLEGSQSDESWNSPGGGAGSALPHLRSRSYSPTRLDERLAQGALPAMRKQKMQHSGHDQQQGHLPVNYASSWRFSRSSSSSDSTNLSSRPSMERLVPDLALLKAEERQAIMSAKRASESAQRALESFERTRAGGSAQGGGEGEETFGGGEGGAGGENPPRVHSPEGEEESGGVSTARSSGHVQQRLFIAYT